MAPEPLPPPPPKPLTVSVSPEVDAVLIDLAGKFDISRGSVVRRAVELLGLYVRAREARQKIGVVKEGEPCFEAVTELRAPW